MAFIGNIINPYVQKVKMKFKQMLIDCFQCNFYQPDKNIITSLRHRCKFQSKAAIECQRKTKKPSSIIFHHGTKECALFKGE